MRTVKNIIIRGWEGFVLVKKIRKCDLAIKTCAIVHGFGEKWQFWTNKVSWLVC